MKTLPGKPQSQPKPADGRRTADDTLTLYLKELQGAQAKFEGMIERIAKLREGQSAGGELADDLLEMQRVMRETIERHTAELQTEIIERRRAQSALAKSQVGLQRAQVLAKLAHVVTGPDGAFETWSDNLPLLVGVPADEMPRSTREWLQLVHPDDRALLRNTAIDAGVANTHRELEYRLKHPAGWMHVRQTMEPLHKAAKAGEERWFNTLQDITEQKVVAERYRSGEQLLDNIVENIPTAVQLKSVEDGYRILMWNKAAEAMYGLPREEAIGRNVHDLWPKAVADHAHAADLELVASGRMQDFPNRPAQTRNRGEIRVHMRKVALFDASGKATHVLVIADDITAQLADQARLRESEERFRSLSMLSSDWFWEQDAEHRFVRFSGGEGVEGWGPDQSKAIGLHRWDLGGVVPMSCSWDEHKAMLDAHQPFRGFEYRRILGDGRVQYVEASGEPIFDPAGRFTGYRGVATDITTRKEAEARISRLNRVHAVLSGINALIVRVRDRDELFRESCRVAVEAGGFRMAWIGVVDPAAMVIKPVAWQGADDGYIQQMPVGLLDARPEGRGLAGRAVREKAPIAVDDMTQDPRILLKEEARQRDFRSLVILPLMVRGEAAGVLALYAGEIGFFDEDEMKLLAELAGDIAFAVDHIDKADKLEYLAYYDPLTGLANRSLFLQRLGQKVLDAGAAQRKVAVWILDIERFRAINDAFGRHGGDKLLQDIAARMKALAKDDARMARIGGDQIAIMRDDMQSEDEIARFSERRIQDIFGEPYRVADQDLRVSGRYGIALFPADGGNAEALLQNAEAALKKAKATGERYVFFAQEMTERTHEKLALESRLRQALEKDEFVLHYQLKVDSEKRTVTGVEGLIRWQSAEGLVPPGRFIPLMEQTGMIREAGAWALRRAVLDHRHWLRMGIASPRVAVNVSPIQLRQQDFVETVKEAISQGANPPGLDLEITESLIMEDVQGNIRKLKAIRDLGVSVAIDDFGTGYSSLAYLAKLPVETLKIDRSFIIGMLTDPNTMMLIQTMINLAHSLRLKVVAEGVETEEQAKMLRLLRCDELQGYLVSKPVPIEDVTPLLRELGRK